jgi:hypothetical protein
MRRVSILIRHVKYGEIVQVRLRKANNISGNTLLDATLTHQVNSEVALRQQHDPLDYAFRCWNVRCADDNDLNMYLEFSAWKEEVLVPLRLSIAMKHGPRHEHHTSEADLCLLMWGRKEIKHMGQTKGFTGNAIVFE